jgi:hypothetical protein
MRDVGAEWISSGLDPYAILSRTTSLTFTFVPAIQATPRSSSSICVAKVAVTRYLALVYASDDAGDFVAPTTVGSSFSSRYARYAVSSRYES